MSSASSLPHHRAGAGAAGHDADRTGERSRPARLAARVRPELVLLLLVAAFLNLWNLSVNGEANTYYSAAVRSMSESWSAFFWGTFDPAGLMTVDKPPLALWVQAASVRVFGWSSWSYLVPQALMGIAAVGLTYDVTRRAFGRAGGFAAGLALALTPTAVAIFRHNNPDAALMLCITVALWAAVRGLETGRTRWLVWAGVAIGLGFEAKMAAALMVAPAIGAAWLWVRPGGSVRRTLGQLTAFGASAAAVGLAWPLAVALTPASDRPWISGTSDNSIWSLIFGYNGLGRLLGQDGGPGGPGGGMGGGGFFGGSTGPLRLLNESLGSQGGWLLGMAIGAGLLVLVATRLRRTDLRTGWLIATGGAFAISAVAFSFASGIFHPYYVSALAPFTAALVGAGVGSTLALARGEAIGAGWVPGGELLGSARGGDSPTEGVGARRRTSSAVLTAIAGAALVAGALSEAVVLGGATQLTWLSPVLLVGTLAAAGTLFVVRDRRVRTAAVIAATSLLLVAPGVWSAQTIGHNVGSTFPTGGPSGSGMGGPGGGRGGMGRGGAGVQPPQGFGGFGRPSSPGATGGFPGMPPQASGSSSSSTRARGAFGGGGMFGGDQSSVNSALAYAKANGGGTLVVSGQSGAASSILSSNADVAGIGGFSGRESEVSVTWFADRVQGGDIRWVLTSRGGLRDSRTGSNTVMTAVTSTCKAVSSVDGLYDCQGQDTALRSAAS
ncbi:MAG: glycosyltransferase family 39 protein [Patulibacter minatonensis]